MKHSNFKASKPKCLQLPCGLLFAGVLFFGSAISGVAVTVGFEGSGVASNGVISPIPLPYNEGEFVLSNGIPAAESGIFGADVDGEANSGSDFFGWAFNGRIILEDSGGDPFSFHSFDAGHIGEIGGLPAVLTLHVTGILEAGGSVFADFNYTNPWQTFILPGTFVDLDRVEFLTSVDGGAGIDNLVLNERRAVPDFGTTLFLLAPGLLGLGLFHDRMPGSKKSVHR